MILEKIELVNFRQYYGQQTISFSEDEKNTTIILGLNGKGKTGFLMALDFCLFGLDKSFNDVNNIKELVNINRLKEKFGESVEAGVTLYFNNKGCQYILKRTIQARMISDSPMKIQTGSCSVSMDKVLENGQVAPITITDDIIVSNEISNIISPKISDFYFFDGEKIQYILDSDKNKNLQVENTIKKILQIDSIENSISILKEIKKEVTATYTNILSSNKAIIALKNKKVNLEKTLEKNKNIMQQDELYLKELVIELNDLDSKLKSYTDLESLYSKEDSLNEKIKHVKDTIVSIENNISYFFKEKHTDILAINDFNLIKNTINVLEDKPQVSKEFIDYLKKQDHCVCGRMLTEIEKKYIDSLNSICKSNTEILFKTSLVSEINSSCENYSDAIKKAKELLEELDFQEEQLSKLKLELDLIRSEINIKSIESESRESILAFQKSREIKLKTIGSIESNIEKLSREIEDLIQENRDLTLQIQSKSSTEEECYLSNLINYIDKIVQCFSDIAQNYHHDIKEKISKETTNIFKKLISDEDNSISKIKINSKYNIEVYNWENSLFTNNISEGQKQMVCLSYVLALALSTQNKKSTTSSIPLVIDTPFARLDSINRSNLIFNLPLLTNQLILLVTDTEFNSESKVMFEKGDKIGAFYVLNQIESGKTIISKQNKEDYYVV